MRSDHGPITLDFEVQEPFRKRPFRFERMWLTHDYCKRIAQSAWNVQIQGSRAFTLQQKIKNVRGMFSDWNKNVFGKVEKKLKEKQK